MIPCRGGRLCPPLPQRNTYMDKKIEISILCQIYGKLLTEKQYQLIEDYYNRDLSLSEIAENNHITRQAARDNIKKGEKNLLEYESALELMKQTLANEKKIKNMVLTIDKLQAEYTDKKINNELENIKNNIQTLI